MNIGFPEVDEKFIKSKVEAGYYMNETEVVRDAIRHMREEEERRKSFMAAVKLGEQQIANGEGVTFTDELMGNIEKQAIEDATKATSVNNPDSLPK